MNSLRTALIDRYLKEMNSIRIEHRGDPIDIVVESEKAGNTTRSTVRFELHRFILWQVPLDEVPVHSGADVLSWAAMMVRTGRLDNKIQKTMQKGNSNSL